VCFLFPAVFCCGFAITTAKAISQPQEEQPLFIQHSSTIKEVGEEFGLTKLSVAGATEKIFALIKEQAEYG